MDISKIKQAIELLDQADTLIQSAIPHNTEGVDSYGIYCDLQELMSILEELIEEAQPDSPKEEEGFSRDNDEWSEEPTRF